MKLEVQINALLTEEDPSYKSIMKIGLEKAIEKIRKDLEGVGVDSVRVELKEVE
jgi:hypothetical protein